MESDHFDGGGVGASPATPRHAEAQSGSDYSDQGGVYLTSAHRTRSRRRPIPFVDSDSDEDEFNYLDTEYVPKGKGRAIGRGSTAKDVANKGATGKTATTPVAYRSHLPATSAKNNNGRIYNSTVAPPATEPSRNRSESPVFEPEDEDPPLVLRDTTTLTRPHNIIRPLLSMDGLKRARAIKAEIENNIPILQPQVKKTSSLYKVEEDAETQLIKTLREEQEMNWSEIANYLNEKRRNDGKAANFTEAAVYSRFVLNAPRIAVPVGEIGFDTKDYVHLRNPTQYTNADNSGTVVSQAGRKRVKSYDNATELKANMRKHLELEEHEDLETVERTEQLMDAVAKIERNFWVLVADEMERITTKMYQPDELASRYHAV
ncbi:Nn.00g028960.m01.CDS01 [Neocucurbitaria sp. VM-36]